MDDREHLRGSQDAVHFQEALVVVFAFLDGLLVIVAFDQLQIKRLVESVYFVFHWTAQSLDLCLIEPVTVHVASAFVFDEVFELISSFSNSSP